MKIFKILELIGAVVSYIEYTRDRLRMKKLMKNGMKVGKNVYIGDNVYIDPLYPYLVEIGDNCRISSGTLLLVHDATMFKEIGVTRLEHIKILEGSFIGARAIILPGVTIGPRAIIAAGAVVNRDIGEGKLAAGNPARPYGNYSDLLNNYKTNVSTSQIFYKEDVEFGHIDKNAIKDAVEQHSVAYIRGIPSNDPYYIHSDMEEIKKQATDNFKDLMESIREVKHDKAKDN